ncbi:MAG TPA: sensor domain-containing diguanylate cyclase [Eubacteriaceae bacterium]|nr:sensor domain-containing diguanylate cyclase [Eubacteriaceae bacterium]
MDNYTDETLIRMIFDHSSDGIMVTSPDGRVYRANPTACEMFQMTEEEIIARGREGLVDPDDPNLQRALKEREEKGKIKVELTCVKKDGTKFPVSFAATQFYTEMKEPFCVLVVRDLSEEKEQLQFKQKQDEDREHQASHDCLTDTLNRRVFFDRLTMELDRSKREKTKICLIMIDIDHFKYVNDRCGHLEGDKTLQAVAEILKKGKRSYDILSRFGGDEFILCLPNTTIEDAYSIAERMRIKIEEYGKERCEFDFCLSASFGLAEHDGGEEQTEWLKRVDQCLYRAKEKRNYVCKQ